MLYCFLFLGACVELVTANPLVQSIQPCSLTSYQTNYQQPYSDAYILQPSNTNLYSQPVTVQSPLSYQPLLLSSLKDQIYQVYWDKVLSSPTLKSFLDGNSALFNQNVGETQTIQIDPTNPYNTGGVVNNYIILPSDYLKTNETEKPNKRRKEEFLKRNAKPRKKKTNVARRKNKQNNHAKTDMMSGGIKCYTPAEVLDERVNIPIEKKGFKSKTSKSVDRGNVIKPKSTRKISKNKVNQHSKSKKIKKKKVKKKSTSSDHIHCKEHIVQNVDTKSKRRKKRKHIKQGSDCECENRVSTNPLDDDTNKESAQICDKDIFDILNLSQDCDNCENRRARNSKNDASVIDFRKVYPDLPDDISKSFAWYMSDFYSNPQFNSNLFSANNIYPYDFSQIYQFPKYPNDITNKKNDANRSNKRKKKQKKKKKKNPTKKKNEEASVNKDSNATIKRVKSRNEKLRESESEIVSSTIIEEPISIAETTTVIPVEKESKEVFHIASNEECISLGEDTESFEDVVSQSKVSGNVEPNRSNERVIMNEYPKIEPIEPVKIYEIHIPEAVTVNITNNRSELLDNNETEYYEAPDMDLYSYDQFPELGSEDEVPNAFDNRLLEDYYPDFTGDNLKYLSREEIDIQDIYNRYYYLTDNNSRERLYSPGQATSRGSISNKDSSEIERLTNVNNKHYEDKSEEVVFRPPPPLDFPGFITRKVNRDRQDSNDYYYQHNSGEDFERIYYDNFADKSSQSYSTDKYMQPNDKSGSRVETVYARSKVVKYGQSQNHPSSKRQGSHFDSDDRFENNGGKMVVIAKSFGPEDSW